MADPGVPLSKYDPESFGVRFDCSSCRDSFDVPLLEVIDRLKARRIGDEHTGIRAVATLSTKPCSRCGAVKWMTMPAHHPRPRRKT